MSEKPEQLAVDLGVALAERALTYATDLAAAYIEAYLPIALAGLPGQTGS